MASMHEEYWTTLDFMRTAGYFYREKTFFEEFCSIGLFFKVMNPADSDGDDGD